MGIFKESLDKHIVTQFQTRQEILSLKENRSGQLGGAFHAFTTNKHCNLRMASCVDIVGQELLDLELKVGNVQLEKEYIGAGLARSYILQGGLLLNPKGAAIPAARRGFPGGGRPLGGVYGDPLARANAQDGYGLVPMPGIQKMNIRTKSAYGSLREAKVDFTCHNLRQLALLELLYMRPGFPIMLEWQWTPYVIKDPKDNKIKVEKGMSWVSDLDYFWGRTFDGAQIDPASQTQLYDEIHFRRQSSQGNYDGVIGLCKNFSYSARPDGGFNCTTELMAVGETVSSVKGNVIQYIQPSFKKKPGGSGGASDDVIGTDVASHMPILLDLLEKTHDFRYNINSVDVWGKDGTAVNRAEESRMSITNGENDQLGDEDDEVEIGAKFNRSAAYQKKASISGNGFWNPFYSERVNIYNIDRADLEEQYKNEFLNTNTDCPHDGGLIIKEDVHIINFKEGRTGWQNFLVGSVGSISTLITANINIGLAAASQLLAYQNDNLGCSEAYIRLDALCYMINKYVLPSEKKFFESQKNENRIVAFQTMTYNPYLNRYVANPYKQYEGNVLDLLKENLGSSPGFNIMRGVMDMSTDPYVCLMPKQVTGATTKEYVDGIESVPVANNFGFQKDHFLEDGVFAKSFPLKAEASKTEASANPLFDFQQNSFMAGIIEEVARKKAGVASAKEASQGYIGHIMLNIRHLLKIHDGIYTKEGKVGSDYSVGKFMEKVVESINKVMAGNVKLGLVTDNTHPGVTSIVDLNMDPQVDYKDIFKFDVLSSTSAVRNFSFNSAIPSAMASTIAVGAGDPDNADSLDAVTFAAMNRGLKNRLYQKQVGASGEVEVTDEEKEAAKEKMKAEFEEVIEITNALVQFQVNVCSGQMFEADIEDDSKAGNIRTQVSRLKDLVNILSMKDDQGFIVNDKEKNPPSSTPIPIKLDMTFDGISGLTMGQLFRVNETRLPQAYRNKNVIFVVVAEDQTVDENGNWTTKISGQMQLFPGKPSSDAAASVLPKTAGVEGFDPKPICDALFKGMKNGGTADSVYTILDPLSPEEVRMVDIYWRYDIEQRNQGDNLLMWLHDDLRTNNAEVQVYNKYAEITCADGGYALADRVKSGAAHIPADMFNNYRGPNKRFLKTAGEKKAEKKKNDKKLYEAQQDRNVSGGNPIDMGAMK